jgi:hypothetical protein
MQNDSEAKSGISNVMTDTSVNSNDQTIRYPNPYDVLCGKDKTYQQHPGNQIFRNYIREYGMKYKEAKQNKNEKMKITKEIVGHLKTVYNSRFLKRIDSSYVEAWEEISENDARDKIS